VLLISGLVTRADTLLNDFSAPFDYVANGIIGDTNWDGVYLRFGDVPNGAPAERKTGTHRWRIPRCLAEEFLGVQNIGGDWSGNDSDGFFIYKVVKGDFDMSVDNVPAL